MTKRQENALKTRKKLLDTAENLLKSNGFSALCVEDITNAAGVAKGTFYVYFKQKDDLVGEVLSYLHTTRYEQTERHIQGKSTIECVKAMVELPAKLDSVYKKPPFNYDLQKYYPSIYKRYIQLVCERTQAFIIRHLEQGIEEGIFRKDIDTEMCATFYILMQQAYIRNINNIHAVSPKRLMAFSLDTFVHTVLTAEGLEQLKKLQDSNKQ